MRNLWYVVCLLGAIVFIPLAIVIVLSVAGPQRTAPRFDEGGNVLTWEDPGGGRDITPQDNPRVFQPSVGTRATLTADEYRLEVWGVPAQRVDVNGTPIVEWMTEGDMLLGTFNPELGSALVFDSEFDMVAGAGWRNVSLHEQFDGGATITNPTRLSVTKGGVLEDYEAADTPLHRGAWDAAANAPHLNSTCDDGLMYTVSIMGGTVLNGFGNWSAGDSLVCLGGVWAPILASSGNGTAFVPAAGQLVMNGSMLGLANHGPPGHYVFPILDVDAFGRTSATNGTGVVSVNGVSGEVVFAAGAGVSVVGTTIALATPEAPLVLENDTLRINGSDIACGPGDVLLGASVVSGVAQGGMAITLNTRINELIAAGQLNFSAEFVEDSGTVSLANVTAGGAYPLLGGAVLASGQVVPTNVSVAAPLWMDDDTLRVVGASGVYEVVANGTWSHGVLTGGTNLDLAAYVAAQIVAQQLNLSADFTDAGGELALTNVATPGTYAMLAGTVSSTGRLTPSNVSVTAPLVLGGGNLHINGVSATYSFVANATYSSGVLQSADAFDLYAYVTAQIADAADTFSADFVVVGHNVSLAPSGAAGVYTLMSGTVGTTGRMSAAANVVVTAPLTLSSNTLALAIGASLTSGGGVLGVSYGGAPPTVGAANAAGSAATAARSDHVHAHGAQTDGTMHAGATGAVAGFMSAADKTKLDAATALQTASTLALRDGSGASGFTSLLLDTARAIVTSAVQGGTRTFTIPATASDVFAMLAATQTLTNKDLTSTTNVVRARYIASASGSVDVQATAPTSGQVLTASSATTAVWSTPASGGMQVYVAGTLTVGLRMWVQTVVTSTASATFYVTTNGLVGGASFCPSLATASIGITAQYATATIIQMPLASVRTITGDTLVVGVFTGTTAVIAGNTLIANSNAVSIHLQVIC